MQVFFLFFFFWEGGGTGGEGKYLVFVPKRKERGT
uniref:Uncharacterized protein n=1 Tax=Rhizophora mucronata TaxID=61149 RepID=A0A2P2KAA5_RHIMU